VQHLYGRRIPIDALHNVTKIEWASLPTFADPVFYDDPSLIAGYVSDTDEAKARDAKWIKVLETGKLKVTYGNPEFTSKEWKITDLQKLNYAYGSYGGKVSDNGPGPFGDCPYQGLWRA